MKKRLVVKKNIIIVILFICLILLTSYLIYTVYIRNSISKNIFEELSAEYGDIIIINDFFKDNYDKYDEISISPNLTEISEVGRHKLTLTINGEKFIVYVNIEDTTPPTLEVRDLTIYIDEEMPQASDFVIKLVDLSEVKLCDISFTKEVGEHNIEIIAEDEYGNRTAREAKLTIKEDKEPPVFSGLSNLTAYVGERPNLNSGVEAIDERYGSVEFIIDDSKVNYNAVGNYIIYYTASDELGNSVTKERKLTKKEKNITYMIDNFPTYSQFPNYPNGCESIALYTLLKYYGVNVSPDNIVDKLKKGEGPYWEDGELYGGNPEVEFVGDPRAKNGYGVYQKPIIDVANNYKSGMIDYTGHSLNQVLELVKQKIPVQVWVSINLQDTDVCTSWTYKSTGKKVDWICRLHSVVITGFNNNYVYVSDPYVGDTVKYNRSQFQKIYNLFGKRAIYYKN